MTCDEWLEPENRLRLQQVVDTLGGILKFTKKSNGFITELTECREKLLDIAAVLGVIE